MNPERIEGYRPWHATDCPARTGWTPYDCTCRGLEHPLWNPGDVPARPGAKEDR